jgi:hypothetical protein
VDQKGVSSIFVTGDMAKIDLDQRVVYNLSNNKRIELKIKLPQEVIAMYTEGGLIPYHKNR